MAADADFAVIEPALAAMLGPCERLATLPPGTSGTSYLVDAGGLRCVVKHFDAAAPVLLGPEQQCELLGVLATAGIAPAPLGVDADAGLLVTCFVADAASLPMAALRAESACGQLAELLGRLHAVDFPVPVFDPAGFARAYLADIGGDAALSGLDRRRLAELLELAAAPLPGAPGLCHNDLAADNILLGASPRLIDFDYAVCAPPIVDLASVAVMNAFGSDAALRLAERYFGGPPPFGREEFARVQRLLRLLAHFWAQASPGDRAEYMTQYRIDDD